MSRKPTLAAAQSQKGRRDFPLPCASLGCGCGCGCGCGRGGRKSFWVDGHAVNILHPWIPFNSPSHPEEQPCPCRRRSRPPKLSTTQPRTLPRTEVDPMHLPNPIFSFPLPIPPLRPANLFPLGCDPVDFEQDQQSRLGKSRPPSLGEPFVV